MRYMLLAAAASVLLAAAPAFAQSAGMAPGQAASDSGKLPWKAGNQHAATVPSFYDYMARASGAGGSVPFIGEIAGQNDQGAAVIGWTGGESGMTAGSGSSTNPGSQTAAETSNGQPLSDMALAKAAVQWDESAQTSQREESHQQASTGQNQR